MNRRSALLATSTVVALVASMATASAASATSGSGTPTPRLRPTASLAYRLGGLPADPASYARLKAALDARNAGRPWSVNIPQTVTPPCPTTGSPNCIVSQQGIDQIASGPAVTPAQAAVAAGSSRVVEFTQGRAAVYDKSGTLLSQDSLANLTNIKTDTLFNPQLIWSSLQGRFFFVMNDSSGTKDNIAWGFSLTDSPATATRADWCTYTSGFGNYGGLAFPSSLKIGENADFVLIGANQFDPTRVTYDGSHVSWTTKPAAGPLTSCPSRTTFTNGTGGKLLHLDDGTPAWSPVPSYQQDNSGFGWISETHDVGSGGSSTFITIARVVKKVVGGQITAQFGARRSISLPSAYAAPPDAPQAGSSMVLDTGDGRLMNSVTANDPSHPDPNTGTAITGLWTAQAIAGGAGAMVRWYEIDPVNGTLVQTGDLSDASLYTFNGAIAPDRANNDGSIGKKFGSNMVLGFDTSSASTDVAVQMVSKVGANAVSPFVLLAQSPGPNEDSTCTGGVCPWGYAGAAPDPIKGTGATVGRVWLANVWNQASPDATGIDWQTWLAQVRP